MIMENAAAKAPDRAPFKTRIGWTCLEIIAPVIWLYALVKLFVFDIDTWILRKYMPSWEWVLDLRLFVLLGVASVFWLAFGNKTTLKWFLYVLFYPIILILVRIPWLVFKQKSWTLAVAVINSLISGFRALKYNFISTALFLVALAVIFALDNRYALWTAGALLFVLVVVTYVRKIWIAFRPSGLFQVYVKLFRLVRKMNPDPFALDEEIRNLPMTRLSEQQLQKRTEKLQMAVLFNRVCLFTAHRLRDYQNSGWQFIPPVLTVLWLVVFTSIAFAGMHYALFRLDADLYSYSTTPTVFAFVYMSFNTLHFSAIPDLRVAAPLSQALSMAEEFCAFVLVVILAALYISGKGERYSEELGSGIEELEREGVSMEGVVRDQYGLNSIEDALAELERLRAGMVGFLFKLSQRL